MKSQLIFVHTPTEGALTIFSTDSEVERDEPLFVVAAVVGQLVPWHGMALGGASVAAVTSFVGQATHRNEREGAAVTELNLPARVCLVESSELHVGAGHEVSIAECVL